MQQTVTITKLLRDYKSVVTLVNNSKEPIAVTSNSKIIYYLSKVEQKDQKIVKKSNLKNKTK
jgi:uncharacterized protein YaiI (UPF0178 family)